MFTSNGKGMNWRLLVAAVVVSGACFLLMPRARADIVKVNGGVACGNLTQTVDNCPGNGTTPWQLSALLTQLETPNILGSLGEGTDVFEVTGLSAPSFSFTLASAGVGGTGVANNGKCDITGGASSLFTGCAIKDTLGQTTSFGGAQINFLTFPALITFSGFSGSSTSVFELDFVSMQGTSNVVSTPEPSTLSLLAIGLFGLIGFASRKLNT